MNVIRKDAAITNVGTDEDFPGSFEVILSTPEKDRDGDQLAVEDWKTPLPDHITFDTDHGMSVEKTVGSGVPSIEGGNLIVRGTYSSLPRAQEVRTLVNEGHIKTTSVAFMSEKESKGGKSRTVRELLNGAFVAVPSNRGARVLSAKAGARNSKSDQQNIQAAHDSLLAAGAECGPMDDTGADEGATGGKSISEIAKSIMSPDEARAVVGVESDGSMKAYRPGHDPAALAQGVDAALDEALTLLVGIDQSTLPEPVAQALGLLNAAAMGIDELLDVMGVDDPDDPDEDAAAGDAAPADAGDAAKAVDAEVLALKYRSLSLQLDAAIAG